MRNRVHAVASLVSVLDAAVRAVQRHDATLLPASGVPETLAAERLVAQHWPLSLSIFKN